MHPSSVLTDSNPDLTGAPVSLMQADIGLPMTAPEHSEHPNDAQLTPVRSHVKAASALGYLPNQQSFPERSRNVSLASASFGQAEQGVSSFVGAQRSPYPVSSLFITVVPPSK